MPVEERGIETPRHEIPEQKSIVDKQASFDDRNSNRNQQPEKETHIKKSSRTENTVLGPSGLFDAFSIPTFPPLRIGGNVEIPLEMPLPQIPPEDVEYLSSARSLSEVSSSTRLYSRAWVEDSLEKREQKGDIFRLVDDKEKEKRRWSHFQKKSRHCFHY